LVIGPTPQSPIPNPQSPIPNPHTKKKYLYLFIIIKLKNKISKLNNKIKYIKARKK